MTETARIFAINRPSPSLLKYYAVKSILGGPLFFIIFPTLLIRYLTLNYRFDDNGITMRWGFLFRREVNLAYTRIQDIHLFSGIIQRWFGLADIMIQTASGNASAEMKIEGLHEFEEIRSFIYSRMRGQEEEAEPEKSLSAENSEAPVEEILCGILEELRSARKILEHKSDAAGGENNV